MAWVCSRERCVVVGFTVKVQQQTSTSLQDPSIRAGEIRRCERVKVSTRGHGGMINNSTSPKYFYHQNNTHRVERRRNRVKEGTGLPATCKRVRCVKVHKDLQSLW